MKPPASFAECQEQLELLNYLRKSQCKTVYNRFGYSHNYKPKDCAETLDEMNKIARECRALLSKK